MTVNFTQAEAVTIRGSRLDLYNEHLRDKHTLHVGCADAPIVDHDNNLHLQLLAAGHRVHGYDPAGEFLQGLAAEAIRRDLEHDGFSDSLARCAGAGPFDVVLIPEVLEHVPNVATFFAEIQQQLYPFEQVIISVPNAFAPVTKSRMYVHNSVFYEEVHPDHNYWFSPYTLANCIRKYASWRLVELLLVENEEMVVARCLA